MTVTAPWGVVLLEHRYGSRSHDDPVAPALPQRYQDALAVGPRRRAGILRLHHLRLLRHGHRPAVLSTRHAGMAAPDPDLRHLCRRLSGQAAGRHRHGALRRPAGAQADVHAIDPADGAADTGDRLPADLSRHRLPGAAGAGAAAHAAGRGRGRRGAGCLGVRHRACPASPCRSRLRHAVGRIGGRHSDRLAGGGDHEVLLHPGGTGRRRLANPVPARRHLRAGGGLSSPLAARDAGLRRDA